MRPEQVHGVVGVVTHILERAAGIQARLIRVSWSDGLSGLPPLSVGIGIEGGTGGVLCLLLEHNVGRAFAEKMTRDPALAEADDDEVATILLEMLNMIAGNAISILTTPEVKRSITTPFRLDPAQAYFQGVRVVLAQMDSSDGRFHVAMYLDEA